MKISEEFRKAAENPSQALFFTVVSPAAASFAMKYIDYGAGTSTLEHKTLAYLFLAEIAESEGL